MNAQTQIYAIMAVVLTLWEVIDAYAQRDGPVRTVTRTLMNAMLTLNCAITDHVRTVQAVIAVVVIKETLDIIVRQRSTFVGPTLVAITERVPRAHVDLPVTVEHRGVVIHATYTTIVTSHLAKTKERAAVQTVHLHATVCKAGRDRHAKPVMPVLYLHVKMVRIVRIMEVDITVIVPLNGLVLFVPYGIRVMENLAANMELVEKKEMNIRVRALLDGQDGTARFKTFVQNLHV